MENLRTIRLYGKLGAQFGRVHRLAVDSTAEAIRALCVLVPGFERELMTSRDRGVRYACFVGKQNIGKDDLLLRAGGDDIRIAPVLTGSKRGGLIQTIVGAVLIVVGVYTGIQPLTQLGISMVIGGVVQMLSPQPKSGSDKSDENGASYNFTGPVNTTAQGSPVPVLYGRMIVGSAVISAGILAEDQAYIGAPLTGSPIPKVLDTYQNLQ